MSSANAQTLSSSLNRSWQFGTDCACSRHAPGHWRRRIGSATGTAFTCINEEPLNPCYQAFRRRVDAALTCWGKGEGMTYMFDAQKSIYDQYRCFLDLLDGAANHTIAEWMPIAKDCEMPYRVAGHELCEVGDQDRAKTDRCQTGRRVRRQFRPMPILLSLPEGTEGPCPRQARASALDQAGTCGFSQLPLQPMQPQAL